MNRIDMLFRGLKRKRRKAFIVYIAAGDPSLSATERLVRDLEKNGADLVELGIPFSDPLADGPTIQRASQRALSKGVRARGILRMVRRLRKSVSVPIVFMTYYNPVMQYGIKRFVRDSKSAGVDGIIVPDLPPEEAGELLSESRRKDFSLIFLAAPTSTGERLREIVAKTRGFVYYVSLTGTTGARKKLPGDITRNVAALKRLTAKPVCVGFGISNPEQAKSVARFADGIIVGSAVIKVIEKNLGKHDLHKKVTNFVKTLERAIHE